MKDIFGSILNFYRWWILLCDKDPDYTAGFVFGNIAILIAVMMSIVAFMFAHWIVCMLIACVWIPMVFTIWMKFSDKAIDKKISILRELEKKYRNRYY